MQGNIKMPVPVGINKDTDASVEPRRWDLFFLAGSITRKKEESQKGQSKTKSSIYSPDPKIKSIPKILSN